MTRKVTLLKLIEKDLYVYSVIEFKVHPYKDDDGMGMILTMMVRTGNIY